MSDVDDAKRGVLYLVATPIGNLEDITFRALRTLKAVDLVAAEDTRSARHLLGHFGVTKLVLSYFEGNEIARAQELLVRLQRGERIALISEAGTPALSDPGYRLVVLAVEAGIPVESVPGPCAAVTALVASGLPTDRFVFLGFPSRSAGKRKEQWSWARALPATLILYEAPRRVGATLAELQALLGGDRRAVVARELTKLHEELVRGTLAELAEKFSATPPRGEVTLLIEGASASKSVDLSDLDGEVSSRLDAGESPRLIADTLAERTGGSRRAIYQLALKKRDSR